MCMQEFNEISAYCYNKFVEIRRPILHFVHESICAQTSYLFHLQYICWWTKLSTEKIRYNKM